jgi:hypothetical protein
VIGNVEMEPVAAPAAVFVVGRRLTGFGVDELVTVHRALAESARRLSARGEPVRFVRCTFVPAAARCQCVFEGTSADLVRRVNEVAQVPFDGIERAIEFEGPS